MPSPSRSVYHFHGCAHAFSGLFTRPFHEQIDAQAQSTLPITGGHGCARVEDFRFREFITFDAGYTHVSGGFQADDETNNILVTSTIEGLNMLDVLTADRIVCRLYSKHQKRAGEGDITMHGSKFENLQICGKPVTIELDFKLFENLQTFAAARKAYDDPKSEFHARAADPLGSGAELPPQQNDGVFLCSLVKNIQVDPHLGVTVDRHSIYVPGFGRVYFAEVFMTHGQRSLTMFRYELGSSTGGTGSGGSGGTGGKQYPPGG